MSGNAQWSPAEALEQALAALPDASFAAKYNISPALIHRVNDALSEAQNGHTEDVFQVLREARAALPKAWPEDAPSDLFAAIDATITDEYRNVLRGYPDTMRVAEAYDEDDLFADALNALIPNFEYPDYSHKTVAEINRLVERVVFKVVSDGQHIGPIVELKNGIAVQDVGRGKLVGHDLSKFSVPPAIGEKLDITYDNGTVKSVGNLTDPCVAKSSLQR